MPLTFDAAEDRLKKVQQLKNLSKAYDVRDGALRPFAVSSFLFDGCFKRTDGERRTVFEGWMIINGEPYYCKTGYKCPVKGMQQGCEFRKIIEKAKNDEPQLRHDAYRLSVDENSHPVYIASAMPWSLILRFVDAEGSYLCDLQCFPPIDPRAFQMARTQGALLDTIIPSDIMRGLAKVHATFDVSGPNNFVCVVATVDGVVCMVVIALDYEAFQGDFNAGTCKEPFAIEPVSADNAIVCTARNLVNVSDADKIRRVRSALLREEVEATSADNASQPMADSPSVPVDSVPVTSMTAPTGGLRPTRLSFF